MGYFIRITCLLTRGYTERKSVAWHDSLGWIKVLQKGKQQCQTVRVGGHSWKESEVSPERIMKTCYCGASTHRRRNWCSSWPALATPPVAMHHGRVMANTAFLNDKSIHPSIHPSSISAHSSFRVTGVCWSLSQPSLDESQGYTRDGLSIHHSKK